MVALARARSAENSEVSGGGRLGGADPLARRDRDLQGRLEGGARRRGRRAGIGLALAVARGIRGLVGIEIDRLDRTGRPHGGPGDINRGRAGIGGREDREGLPVVRPGAGLQPLRVTPSLPRSIPRAALS